MRFSGEKKEPWGGMRPLDGKIKAHAGVGKRRRVRAYARECAGGHVCAGARVYVCARVRLRACVRACVCAPERVRVRVRER